MHQRDAADEPQGYHSLSFRRQLPVRLTLYAHLPTLCRTLMQRLCKKFVYQNEILFESS